MDVIEQLRGLARKNPKRIVLPEGGDIRTLKAASILKKEGIAEPVLVGVEKDILDAAQAESVDLEEVQILTPGKDKRTEEFVEKFFDLRKHKGLEKDDAAKLMDDPIHFGTMLLHGDHVDGFLAGAAHATADTIRPALQVIKLAPGARAVSSFFIMVVPNCKFGDEGIMLMADCAINPDPAPAKLALIAISTAKMAKALLGLEPRVAMLSFSTLGSAEHELVDKVRSAVGIAKKKAPDLLIDGEMQADAALVPEIGQRKAPDSPVAGKANVLVFPDLQSANIGYKLVQRLAGAEAVGPILQGFNKPVNDLSRGASVNDIVNLAAVTVLQATNPFGNMPDISIDKSEDGAGWIFRVTVAEGGSSSSHQVRLSSGDFERLTRSSGLSPEELVHRSFEFLLEREPKESILSRFDLTVIGRYFPDYEKEIA